MSNRSEEVRDKLIQLMKADAPIVALVVDRIFDDRPGARTIQPYITLDAIRAIPFDTKDIKGFVHSVTVNVWDDRTERSRVKDIQALIYDLFHDKRITLSGGKRPDMLFTFDDLIVDEDGRTLHGIVGLELTSL